MSNRNASPSAFGWDFQVNSAILLMLENIKDAKRVRVEGADEDIEITLQNQSKIYAQAKSVTKPDDYSHVNDKLTEALETLSLAAQNGDGSLFTYITNSPNPFNNQKIMSFFTGRTHLDFDELPGVAQKKIEDIIRSNEYTGLDTRKMDFRVIPFYRSGRQCKGIIGKDYYLSDSGSETVYPRDKAGCKSMKFVEITLKEGSVL